MCLARIYIQYRLNKVSQWCRFAPSTYTQSIIIVRKFEQSLHVLRTVITRKLLRDRNRVYHEHSKYPHTMEWCERQYTTNGANRARVWVCACIKPSANIICMTQAFRARLNTSAHTYTRSIRAIRSVLSFASLHSVRRFIVHSAFLCLIQMQSILNLWWYLWYL